MPEVEQTLRGECNDVRQFQPQALHEVVDAIAERQPKVLAAVDDASGSITYEELACKSMRLAQVLLQQKLLQVMDNRPLGTLMRRSCNWLLLYIATMRCGVPIMALSVDLSDRAAETKRNLEVLQTFLMQCLVFEQFKDKSRIGALESVLAAQEMVLKVMLLQDLMLADAPEVKLAMPLPAVGQEELLAFCYTGGTTRASKAVRISHAMALHETERYSEVLPEGLRGSSMRFLQNSSAYWGAALLGQLDVALAMEGTSVICHGTLPSEIVKAICYFGVTAFGAVPSVLAEFRPLDVPTVQCVIAWAEDLPEAVAALWRGKVALRDILIATEYWLTFYSSREKGRSLDIVGGLDVQILLPQDSKTVSGDEIGEVCISGPTVSPGYVDPMVDVGRFVELSNGRRYFRTRDLARWVDLGKRLEYCGRCDDMAKVGGKWVDVSALEQKVCGLPGVQEAKLVFTSGRRQVFVVLAKSCHAKQQQTLGAIQQNLPLRTAVHIVAKQSLPRHPATRKVDTQKLLQAVTEDCSGAMRTLARRRGRVLSRFARAWRCAAQACHNDPRRMLCLAYIWYAVMYCRKYGFLKALLDENFPLQGGAQGVLLCWVWSLPLRELQQLAAPGAAFMRKARWGLQWVVIFWSTLPHWLVQSGKDAQSKRIYTVEHASERLLRALQSHAVKMKKRICPTCKSHVITLYPSLDHCCNACQYSAGLDHDANCLRQDLQGWRKCKNCEYGVTWDLIFCCHWCREAPGNHGRYCNKSLPMSAAPRKAELQQDMDASVMKAVVEQSSCLAPKEAASIEGGTVRAGDEGAPSEHALTAIAAQHNDQVAPKKAAPADSDFAHAGDEVAPLEDACTGSGSITAATTEVDETTVADIVARIVGGPLFSTSPDLPTGSGDGDGNATKERWSLDSLRALRLLAAIQQELGRAMALRDVIDCTSVAELIERIRNAPVDTSSERLFRSPGHNGFRLWTFGWRHSISWMLRCKRKLDKGAVLAAVKRLMQQQPALHLHLGDPWPVHVLFMEAAAVMEALQAMLRGMPQARAGQRSLAVLQASLKHCWPRTHVAPVQRELEDTVFTEISCRPDKCSSIVQKLLHKWKGDSFHIALLSHPEGVKDPTCRTTVAEDATCHNTGDGDGLNPSSTQKHDGKNHAACHIFLMLSHAIADGSALSPLMYDLAHLLKEEEQARNGAREEHLVKSHNAQLPHFGAILEDRLMRTIDGDESKDDLMFLERRMDFFDHHFEQDRKGYHQTFKLMPAEVAELQHVADQYVATSRIEVVLLALVVISLARIHGKPSVRFTIVHHGRDHPPAAASVIGFFTDFRTLVVPTSELISLLGAVHFIATAVCERNWSRPGALESVDTLINLVPSQFDEVGDLAQVPQASWSSPDLWQSKPNKSARRELDFQIEQIDTAEWKVMMYIDKEAYPQEKGRQFRTAWLRALRDLKDNPLQGVLTDPAASEVMSLLKSKRED